MKEQSQQFLHYLRNERGLSPRTIKAYQRDLNHLLLELAHRDISAAGAVTEHDIRNLVARLHRQGQGPRSLQRLLAAIRSFYRWLIKEGLAGSNPAMSIRAPRQARKLPATPGCRFRYSPARIPGCHGPGQTRQGFHGAVLFLGPALVRAG